METQVATASELSQTVDSLADDLPNLMRGASILLQQCERKVEDFKRHRNANNAEATSTVASEISALLTSAAELYKLARAKALLARGVFDCLPAQIEHNGCSDGDAREVLTACRQSGESFEAFDRLIAGYQRQIEDDLTLFRNVSSLSFVTPDAVEAFDKLMTKVRRTQST